MFNTARGDVTFVPLHFGMHFNKKNYVLRHIININLPPPIPLVNFYARHCSIIFDYFLQIQIPIAPLLVIAESIPIYN